MTFDKPTLCNCDARGFNLTDEGTLSSDQLPIYGLQFGGSFTPYSNVKFDIGPLVCSGKTGNYPSEATDVEKETLKSKLNDLTNDIAETKGDLHDLSEQLEDHLRTQIRSSQIISDHLKSSQIISDHLKIISDHLRTTTTTTTTKTTTEFEESYEPYAVYNSEYAASEPVFRLSRNNRRRNRHRRNHN